MSDPVFVIPTPGVVVRDPHTKRVLPESGQLVLPTVFWTRRILVGDVLVRTHDDLV
jgi:hypothetical protein